MKDNPELHYARMMKINKNPEKIEKMAAKHRGMKRSPEACENIRKSIQGLPSNIKGRKQIYNLTTDVKGYIEVDTPLPDGWAYGAPLYMRKPRGKSYTNGIEYKLFKDPSLVPDGWVLGGTPKNKNKK